MNLRMDGKSTPKRHLQRSALSPFRYPGGKSWLWPIILQWLNPKPNILVEPFAGGANTTLAAVSEKIAKKAIIIELDLQVASVWEAVLNGQADWLARKVRSFHMTRRAVKTELKRLPKRPRDSAWLTLLRNRVNHGGILAEGAGLLKQGERGNGIISRWYPETLCNRIRIANSLKSRIQFISGDGLEWLENNGMKARFSAAAFF